MDNREKPHTVKLNVSNRTCGEQQRDFSTTFSGGGGYLV